MLASPPAGQVPSSPRSSRLFIAVEAVMSGCAFDCGRRLAVKTYVDGRPALAGVLLSVKRRLTVSGNPFAGQAMPRLPLHHANGDWRAPLLTTLFASVWGTGLPTPLTQMVREICLDPDEYE